MGGKYEIRYYINSKSDDYNTEYVNNFINFVVCLFKNKGKIIYFTVRP